MKRFFTVVMAIAVAVMVFGSFQNTNSTSAQGGEGVTISLDHPYAAFLESRAYAASLGATAEFRKMEWVTIDQANNRLYMAMSVVGAGMSDGEGDVQLDSNPCGIVYTAQLDDSFNMTELTPLVVGGPYDEANEPNACSVDNISEPDGVDTDARGRVWIAEDTGEHENNMLWVYDPADGSLKRFAYVPLGAEVTGLHVAANGTLFINYQHPDATNIYPFNASGSGVVVGFNANTDDFESIAVPEGEAQKVLGVAAGEYQILGRVGDPIPNAPFGEAFGEILDVTGNTMFFCNQSDGNMYLPTNAAGTEGYLYTNYECTPGGVARVSIRQTADGSWAVLDGEMVDFSGVNGTWINCGSSVSPWNTALTSEEYEPIAADPNSVNGLSAYLGRQANPYDYGYIIEMAPYAVGNDIVKHFAMGRKSNENSEIAGDNRTVYFGDDGTDVVIFKFVAEEAGDLSYGTLYAAKVTQVGGPGADHSFQLEWIELGTAGNDEIEAAIRELDVQ